MNESEFHSEAQVFLEQIFADFQQHQITLAPHWDIDHLCFRVTSEEEYQEFKEHFESYGKLLIESMVGGRLISTYKLNKPVQYLNYKIELVELPAPKKGKPTPTGFEHIEVVCDEPFEVLMEKYKHLTLDTKGLSKELNPELEVVLGERNLKFHHMSLDAVIEIEKGVKS